MTYLILLVCLHLGNVNHIASSKLIENAVYVATKHYKLHFGTSVVWSVSDSNTVDEFLFKFSGTIVTTALSENNNNTAIIFNMIQSVGYMQTIFLATEPEPFEEFMTVISEHLRLPNRLVLILTKFINDPNEMSKFIRIAWKNDLADMVIISRNQKDEITVSTFFPYSNGICDNTMPVKLKLDENMFANKFKNFNKCAIRVSAINVPPLAKVNAENDIITGVSGNDGILLTFIVNRLNATLRIKESDWYGSYANGNMTGAIKDLIFNQADIMIPGAVLNTRYLITQTSHVFYSIDMRWIGPKRRQIYQWIKLFLPFFNNVTPFLCLALTLFVIVVILILRCKLSNTHKTGSVCFQVFTLLLGQSVNYETKVQCLNNLFLLWIWFCFIVRLTYQACLVNSLQIRNLEPLSKSIEDAVKSVESYGGSEGMLDFYRGTPLERNYEVLTQDMFYVYLDHIINGDRFLLILDKIMRERYRHSIQTLDLSIGSTMACLYMRAGWSPAKTIDSILLTLVEGGIIEKIQNLDKRIFRESDKNAEPLNLLMISSSFYGIAFMWLICFLIFLIEIIYYKYSHVENNKRELSASNI